DRVELTNLTGAMAVFSLIGPESPSLLQKLGMNLPPDLPPGHHRPVDLAAGTVRVAAGSGLALPGYTLLIPAADAAALWQQLTAAGALPTGTALWQQLRVCQGRPAPGAELTEAVNPLEAGLWQAISFDKGCYIGQETIARLNTYQGVKQQLWGLQLSQMVPSGESIWVGEEKVGQLTSVVDTPGGVRGLGYIRTKAGGAGLTVTVGEAQGQVVEVPYLSRGYLTPT
ncbi:MAG TPA: folate-binding protein, partial [Leptolyngbyaceae cyanobacterium M65_K2018_010]|nr:folate-binding protein [Leptolyngbyaceae cyanobacterium M65_K2018_010]